MDLFDNVKDKDWVGNKNSVFKTLGASNHTESERQNEDYYATDPKAAELLMQLETFSNNIWECACGEGHLSKVFIKKGYNVKSSDLINRGFGEHGFDFLSIDNIKWGGILLQTHLINMLKNLLKNHLVLFQKEIK